MNSRVPLPVVWLVSDLFYPEETSTSHYLSHISRALTEEFDVRVLCGQPRYDLRGSRAPAFEVHDGVSIWRCQGTTLNKNVPIFRLINAVTIMMSIGWAALRRIQRKAVVIGVTNPPTLPFLLALVCKLRGAQFVLLVHDVYPDTAVAAGVLRSDGWIARVWRRCNGWMYRQAAHIVVVGRDMATLIGSRMPVQERSRIEVITNWADLEEVQPMPRVNNPLIHELNLHGKFVIQYAGNMGPVHNVELLLGVARVLQEKAPDVHFVFIGSGKKWPWIQETIARDRLSNVSILGNLPRSRQAEFLNACDVAAMAFVPGMSGVGVPSRMYNIMAAGRPMIASVDITSEVAAVLEEEAIGWVVPPGDVDAFVRAVLEARAEQHVLTEMGRRSRVAAERKYAFSHVAAAYRATLATVGATQL